MAVKFSSSGLSRTRSEAGSGFGATEIGRGSCRERGEISGVAGSFKKKKKQTERCPRRRDSKKASHPHRDNVRTPTHTDNGDDSALCAHVHIAILAACAGHSRRVSSRH